MNGSADCGAELEAISAIYISYLYPRAGETFRTSVGEHHRGSGNRDQGGWI
jgi:hypothetical protein